MSEQNIEANRGNPENDDGLEPNERELISKASIALIDAVEAQFGAMPVRPDGSYPGLFLKTGDEDTSEGAPIGLQVERGEDYMRAWVVHSMDSLRTTEGYLVETKFFVNEDGGKAISSIEVGPFADDAEQLASILEEIAGKVSETATSK